MIKKSQMWNSIVSRVCTLLFLLFLWKRNTIKRKKVIPEFLFNNNKTRNSVCRCCLHHSKHRETDSNHFTFSERKWTFFFHLVCVCVCAVDIVYYVDTSLTFWPTKELGRVPKIVVHFIIIFFPLCVLFSKVLKICV